MDATALEITCPNCDECFHPEDLCDNEVECPSCEWPFRVDDDGEVIDDNGPDHSMLFEVDAEGELNADEVVTVICPHCHGIQEADGAPVSWCTYCRKWSRFEEWAVPAVRRRW